MTPRALAFEESSLIQTPDGKLLFIYRDSDFYGFSTTVIFLSPMHVEHSVYDSPTHSLHE